MEASTPQAQGSPSPNQENDKTIDTSSEDMDFRNLPPITVTLNWNSTLDYQTEGPLDYPKIVQGLEKAADERGATLSRKQEVEFSVARFRDIWQVLDFIEEQYGFNKLSLPSMGMLPQYRVEIIRLRYEEEEVTAGRRHNRSWWGMKCLPLMSRMAKEGVPLVMEFGIAEIPGSAGPPGGNDQGSTSRQSSRNRQSTI